ncbi:MAG: 50S ribosomal protein L32 [Elusimicrobia bacterium]|nr:50S ribosomal protein L32 [Elusimicrobiota bacterium]
MPNPKRRHSRSRRDMRRASNWRLETQSLSTCPNCKTARLPHRVCPKCGYYRDRVVVPKKEKTKAETAETAKK